MDAVIDTRLGEEEDIAVDESLLVALLVVVVVSLLTRNNSIKYCCSEIFIRFNNSIAIFSHPSSDNDVVDVVESAMAAAAAAGVASGRRSNAH